jgi:DNA-binding XRE family transcriptional regulator
LKALITRDQCRAARALVQMSQVKLAEIAGLAKQTVIDFERGARNPHKSNLEAIRAALEAAGVVFIDRNGGGPGVRLRQ